MEIAGRLMQDAKSETLNDERKVVHFSIAVNDSYKPKGREAVKITTYFNCSYWKNTNLSAHLKKGTLVEMSGRVGVNARVDSNGEAKASLTFHVNTIKLHGKSNRDEVPMPEAATGSQTNEDQTENLPF